MCLGIPSKIISIEGIKATIDVYGAQRDINIMLLEDQVKLGDYVLVHAGFAIQKLQENDAKETLKLFDEYLEALDGPVQEEQQPPHPDNPKQSQGRKAAKVSR